MPQTVARVGLLGLLAAQLRLQEPRALMALAVLAAAVVAAAGFSPELGPWAAMVPLEVLEPAAF